MCILRSFSNALDSEMDDLVVMLVYGYIYFHVYY